MYSTIDDFISDWKIESEMTLKVFREITPEIHSHKVKDDVRSIGRLAWHITQTVTEMPHKAGLFETDPIEYKPIPENPQAIIDAYQKYSAELAEVIKSKWTDAMLSDTLKLYGQEWTKQKLLTVLVKHQIHHRGQMTTLMRLQGIEVPGTYGPSREEWDRFDMLPQD